MSQDLLTHNPVTHATQWRWQLMASHCSAQVGTASSATGILPLRQPSRTHTAVRSQVRTPLRPRTCRLNSEREVGTSAPDFAGSVRCQCLHGTVPPSEQQLWAGWLVD